MLLQQFYDPEVPVIVLARGRGRRRGEVHRRAIVIRIGTGGCHPKEAASDGVPPGSVV